MTDEEIAREFPPIPDDDAFWADAEVAPADFGQKFAMGDKPGELATFVGRFDGTKTIKVDGDDAVAFNFSNADGAFYCWAFFALTVAQEAGKLPPGRVMVKLTFKGYDTDRQRPGQNAPKLVEVLTKPIS